MKKIVGLTRSPFTVRLADRACSVFVSDRDGKILIDEGAGEDRLNGAVLYADQSPRFMLDDAGSMSLVCGTFTLTMGELAGVPDAPQWVEEANDFLASKHAVGRSQTPSNGRGHNVTKELSASTV